MTFEEKDFNSSSVIFLSSAVSKIIYFKRYKILINFKLKKKFLKSGSNKQKSHNIEILL